MSTLEKTDVFRLAVERYADTIYRVAVHAAPCPADAEDVVQDTYERLLHCNTTFETESHLKAWLIRVAINRCHDLTRAGSSHTLPLEESIPAAPETDKHILAAVRALPQNYRDAIYLHYYEGYTAAEIGSLLGTSPNTVLTWLSRGRARLHTLLKEDIEDEVV